MLRKPRARPRKGPDGQTSFWLAPRVAPLASVRTSRTARPLSTPIFYRTGALVATKEPEERDAVGRVVSVVAAKTRTVAVARPAFGVSEERLVE